MTMHLQSLLLDQLLLLRLVLAVYTLTLHSKKAGMKTHRSVERTSSVT